MLQLVLIGNSESRRSMRGAVRGKYKYTACNSQTALTASLHSIVLFIFPISLLKYGASNLILTGQNYGLNVL